MSGFIHKSHLVSALIYPIASPAKHRRVLFDKQVDARPGAGLRPGQVCLQISHRYEIAFLEIGTERNPVHSLVESVPSYSPTKIVRRIKSITARDGQRSLPERAAAEAAALGRGVLVEGLLCQRAWPAWQPGDHRQVRGAAG